MISWLALVLMSGPGSVDSHNKLPARRQAWERENLSLASNLRLWNAAGHQVVKLYEIVVYRVEVQITLLDSAPLLAVTPYHERKAGVSDLNGTGSRLSVIGPAG
jgi:hypothetical protein